jgi:hypothetical protein
VPRLRSIPGGTEPAGSASQDLWEELVSARRPEAFAAPYLTLQCQRVGGVRNALLVLGPPERGPFEVAAVWPSGAAPPVSLLEGAERALQGRRPLVAGAREGAEGGGTLRGGELSLVAAPLEIGGRVHGAVVLQVEARPEAALRELVEELRWGAGWLEATLRRADGRIGHSRRGRLELAPSLLASLLDHDDFGSAARTFVTELATELDCERVSLGFLRRGRVRLAASSHAAHAGDRTNLVRAIEAAMEEALDRRGTLCHPSLDREPAASHAHAELAKQHGAVSLCTAPIAFVGRACGAFTLERSAERPFDAQTAEMLEVVASLVGPVLEVMRLEDRPIGAKLLDAAREHARRLCGPRYVARKLGAVAGVAAVLFFAIARGSYRISADSVLEPAVLRAAVAPFDGYIGSASARAGDMVRAGDPLASLDTRDLRLERVRWQSQVEQLEKQRRQALATREASQVEILAASLAEARAELARIDDRLARADLVAPFDAIVISGDLSQRLGAPVEKGGVLFEVAPLDAYRMILKVEETDVAELRVGQTGRVVFAALPDESVPFRVEKLTPVAVAEEGRNYFRVEASLERAEPRLRPAIEGVAKVEVDRRRLIWIWSHDAIDWLRVALWRWLP